MIVTPSLGDSGSAARITARRRSAAPAAPPPDGALAVSAAITQPEPRPGGEPTTPAPGPAGAARALDDGQPLPVARPAGVAAVLRTAIVQGDLSPGEQIRQAEWADRLGTSRIPVREALKSLAAEGLLSHDHNRGYFVTRFGPHEMAQVYLMRRLLEAALLRSLQLPAPTALQRLADLADAAARAKMSDDFDLWNELEHRFHSQLYALSPLNLVRDEFERLWLLSNIYRRLNMRVGVPADSPAVIYYADMVDALAASDRERMVELMTELREASERGYTRILQRVHA
jgi:DNA-binding GntR family transcriptional regulator